MREWWQDFEVWLSASGNVIWWRRLEVTLPGEPYPWVMIDLHAESD